MFNMNDNIFYVRPEYPDEIMSGIVVLLPNDDDHAYVVRNDYGNHYRLFDKQIKSNLYEAKLLSKEYSYAKANRLRLESDRLLNMI